MGLLHRANLVTASLMIGPLLWSAGIYGAELRTTICDRPVCRTVAVVPEASVKRQPVPEEYVTTEPFLEGDAGDCAGSCANSCGPPQCDLCCLPRREIWTEFDFLLGWRHAIRTPPLVTTSPNGTPQALAGVLNAGSTVIYPIEPFGEEARPGGRITVGTWFDPYHCWGLEGRFFSLGNANTRFHMDSTGDPILARPFLDDVANANAARLLAFPGVSTPGSIDILTESEFSGGDALLRRSVCRWGCGELDLLIGYQFARLDETLVISDLSTDADPANLIQDGTTLEITDQFATRNQYHAAAFGAVLKLQQDNLRWEVLSKIGLGNIQETVAITGRTEVTVPATAPVITDIGLLAQGANLGTFSQDKFCASPEINVKCVYQLTDCIDVSAGYTFLYFTNVAQPGRQIDVDLTVPTDHFRIRETEYWMHAFQAGVSVRF